MKRMSAQNIKEIIDKYRLTWTSLAAGVGVTEYAVRKWVLGKSRPNRNTQRRIEDFVDSLDKAR